MSEQQEQHRSLDEIIRQRVRKIEDLRAKGIEPYPYSFNRTHRSTEIINGFDTLENTEVSVAGRIMTVRLMGKAAFSHIQDGEGRIQIYLSRNDVGEDSFDMFKILDIGDFVGIRGQVMKTRTGEITVKADELTLLSKNIRPLPVVKEKDGVVHDAFTDKELRYRKRYLDLIVNPAVKETFRKRSAILRATRDFFDGLGFLEVETPVLQPLYGGANARPFITKHNALGVDFYLRIADELYLKRLVVGGFEKVYEIAKNFRNEGMDRNHNPEFTAIEFYEAYVDYFTMMDRVEAYFRHLASILGMTSVEYRGHTVDLVKPFARKAMFDLFREHAGVDISGYDRDALMALAREKGLKTDSSWNYGNLIDELFGELVEPHLIQPTFVVDYPREISPLAKIKRGDDGKFVERFELFICGTEYANAFTELNDPLDQRERLEAQAALRAAGDAEAQTLDEDFIQAIETGMPPTGGCGIGLDRLIMFFTGENSIKDVILFPAMRPE